MGERNSYLQVLKERINRKTESHLVQQAVTAVHELQAPQRATEKQAVEAWSRSAVNRLRSHEYKRRSKQEELPLPLDIALRHQSTRDQGMARSSWAPLSDALKMKESDVHGILGEADAVSRLLASVKLRAMASDLSSGLRLVITQDEPDDGLPLSKMVLYNQQSINGGSYQPGDKVVPRDQVENARERLRADDPRLMDLLITSKRLREEASSL